MKYLTALFVIVLFNLCSQNQEGYDQSDSDTTYLESGVKYTYLQKGSGELVQPGNEVSTHINLIIEGDTVWSTHQEGQEIFTFDATKTPLIDGFDEVVMYTRPGDRILAIVPPELGYGEQGSGEAVPPNSTLHFDIEILSVKEGKLYLADSLYKALTDGGMDALLAKYENLKEDTATYHVNGGQWRILSSRLREEERFQEVVDLWNYRLASEFDLGGYYQLGKAHEGLGDIQQAIETLEQGIAGDTTDNPTVQAYLEELKSKL